MNVPTSTAIHAYQEQVLLKKDSQLKKAAELLTENAGCCKERFPVANRVARTYCLNEDCTGCWYQALAVIK